MKCPFCGTDNQPGDTFCSNCGGYLSSSSASAGGQADATIAATGNPGSTTTSSTTPTIVSGTLTPNAKLQNGRYVVEKVLGQGGMGAAVLARDARVSNKRVVIKELVSENTDPTKHQEDVRNFEREVETLAELDHPLIPTVTDSFQENSRYFMVQEYAAGENLEARMERVKQPMGEQEALLYASQVLDILDYLEQQTPPIVHRDIKPANIIVSSKDKRARLVDFGIARAQANKNAKRQQTSALGTPGYAPPEQYQGNADARSDLYALGATLHHLVTNRDPRDYPPFAYPPARSLNPSLSPDIERLLEHALKININERYQNAAAMKRDIDDILVRRFHVSGPMSSPGLTAVSTPLPPTTAASAPNHPPVRPTPPPPPPITFPGPYQQQSGPYQQQAGMYAQPPVRKQRTSNPMARNFILLIVVVLLIGAVLLLPQILGALSHSQGSGSPGNPQPITPASSSSVPGNGIGVTPIGNELVGISDGSYALDTNRADSQLKTQGADKFKKGDTTGALALWRQAVSQDPTDAESLIYLEDLHIANSPHITVVVGTMPSGDKSIVSVARDDLQGAYVAQKEFNDGSKLPNGLKVRVLIASSGGQATNATRVANQIVQLSKSDSTFVGVMGWPYSSLTYPAISVLNQAKIPMVSETASDDSLTGISPYFFRVVPPNKAQGIAGAKYAETSLGAKNVVVFVDPSDPYSQSLGNDFLQQFKADGGNTSTENYTVNNANSVQADIQGALNNNPDLIYFAGMANDVNPLLKGLNDAKAPASLKVLGGDALYELGGYQGGFGGRLRFTAFAYPDEWDILGMGNEKPAFFSDYSAAFNPDGQHSGYGYTRTSSDVMLSYDAMTALLKACAAAADGKSTVTSADLKNALTTTKFQGVSGWISFGADNDPTDKAVVTLFVDASGFIHMDKVIGTFKNS